MKRRKMTGVRCKLGAITLCLFMLCPEISADFLYPLQETQIREAYFLGSGDRKRVAEFLGQYVREYPQPAKGSWVYSVELRTPYEEVVRRAWEKTVGYSAQQARKEYQARPDVVIVRAFISFAATYGSTLPPASKNGEPIRQPGDFRREFPVQVTQTRLIEPKTVSATPLYSKRRNVISGVDILLEFGAEQFGSGLTRVEVVTPEGQRVQAEFDLGKLK